MEYFKAESGLVLPVVDQTTLEYVLSDIEEFKNQFPDLMKKDPIKAAQLIYKTLLSLNSCDIKYKKRYELSDDFNFPISSLLQHFQKYIENDSPDADISTLIDNIHFQMVVNYKLIIDGALQTFFYKFSYLLNSFQYAMHYCSLIHFSCSMQHKKIMPGLWYDLHSLYAIASKIKVTNKKLSLQPIKSYKLNTLSKAYKQNLLLSACDTARFKVSTITNLIYLCVIWVKYVEFDSKISPNSNYYVISPEEDLKPYKKLKDSKEGKNCFYMNLAKINSRLRGLIDEKEKNITPNAKSKYTLVELATSTYTLNRLLTNWHTYFSRVNERMKSNLPVMASIGMNAIYDRTSSKLTLARSALCSRPELEIINIDALYYSGNAGKSENANNIVPCTIIDLSDNGCCLKFDTPVNVSTGEIIGVESEGDANLENIVGIIRWTKNEPILTCGLETIAKNALPVQVINVNSKSQSTYACLINTNPDGSYRIITNQYPFHDKDAIKILCNQQEIEADIYDEQEMSSLYKSYKINVAEGAFNFHFNSNIGKQNADINIEARHS